MENEEIQPEGESQKERLEPSQEQEAPKEEEVVEPVVPEEQEMEPPVVAPLSSQEPLRDPRTGELLRDQSPGVPNSAWVGKHNISDVENTAKEPKVAEADFAE